MTQTHARELGEMMSARTTRRMAALSLLSGLLLVARGGRPLQHLLRARRRGPDATGKRTSAVGSSLMRAVGIIQMAVGLELLGRAPIRPVPFYRVVARLYDVATPIWREWSYRDAYAALHGALGETAANARVLDLGCGTGANLGDLLALGIPFASYTGVDLSAEMLAVAQTKFGHIDRARFQQLDLIHDPLPDGPFDLVVSTWVFEHLPDPVAVVEKAWARLRPDGQAIVMFEAESDSIRSRLVRRIWGLFDARLVRDEETHRFPGLASIEYHDGFLGRLVLVRLVKREVNG